MNKFVKKLALSLTTAAALCFAVTPVNALGSIVANGTTTGQIIQDGKVVEGSTSRFEETFEEVKDDKKVMAEIEKLNEGTKLSDVLVDTVALNGLDINVKEFSLLTKVQDLLAFDADGNPITENATVTWEVPNLTKEAGEVYVLHYAAKGEKGWEVIKPDSIDYGKKEVTATFKTLSPVAVIYKSSSTTVTEDPNTATATNTGLYVGLGAVALGVVGFLVYKKNKA